jgi:competence protein ComEC
MRRSASIPAGTGLFQGGAVKGILAAGSFCALLALSGAAAPQAGTLEAHFIKVGQADATLIRCPDARSYILIDSGDTRYPGSAEAFRAHMKKELDGKPDAKIALAIASHPHADHISSMQWVLETYEPRTYVDNGEKFDSAMWAKLDKLRKKQVKSGKLKYVSGKQAQATELEPCPDVSVEVVVPWAYDKKLTDTNDRSVVVRVAHKKIAFLFVGDAHVEAEDVLLTRLEEALRKKVNADVLKVGHHGSDTSSGAKFVMAVGPQLAVISVGERDVGTNARYKHPRYSTLDTYASWFATADKGNNPPKHPPNGKVWAYDAAKKTWRQRERPKGLWLTIQDGTVVVRSDGSKLDVSFQQ